MKKIKKLLIILLNHYLKLYLHQQINKVEILILLYYFPLLMLFLVLLQLNHLNKRLLNFLNSFNRVQIINYQCIVQLKLIELNLLVVFLINQVMNFKLIQQIGFLINVYKNFNNIDKYYNKSINKNNNKDNNQLISYIKMYLMFLLNFHKYL